ncbi:hypothetical protein BDV23DRAFT_162811 [Aspergillus alliaceus]|uniref:Uncharacterized protein n=1 Tax=Petromyces alliaceus TaxID=209559 RepID=A0A5N7BXV0_PETAA|nr:hypothetical protein BDV23DRAFT_162811 [Aspergillus alliaceus]
MTVTLPSTSIHPFLGMSGMSYALPAGLGPKQWAMYTIIGTVCLVVLGAFGALLLTCLLRAHRRLDGLLHQTKPRQVQKI